jgi:hypothetical protein
VNTDPAEIKGLQVLDQIAAKALDDEDYRRALIAEPKPVLRKEGLVVPDKLEVVVVENTADRVYLVLPSQPPQSLTLDVGEVDLGLLIPFNKF